MLFYSWGTGALGLYSFLLSFHGPLAFPASVLLTLWKSSPYFRLPQSPFARTGRTNQSISDSIQGEWAPRSRPLPPTPYTSRGEEQRARNKGWHPAPRCPPSFTHTLTGLPFGLCVCRASWAGGNPHQAPRTGPGPEGLPASRASQRGREGEREPLGEVPPQLSLSSRGKATWRPSTARAIGAHAGQGHRPSSLLEHGSRTCLPPSPSLALSTLPVTRPLRTPPRSHHLEPLLVSSGQASKHHAGEERLQGMPRWAGR